MVVQSRSSTADPLQRLVAPLILWFTIQSSAAATQTREIYSDGGVSNRLVQEVDELALDGSVASANTCELWNRPQLTGNWCGSRETLAECGFSVLANFTQY